MRASTPAPAGQWKRFPNLSLRPKHSPNLGKGRIQRQVRRAFLVAGKPVLSSSEIYKWVYPGKRKHGWFERWNAFVVLRAACHRVGRASTRGQPWLWKLRQPIRVAKAVADDAC